MPNIGALLKQEIVRLARKEARVQVHPTHKASAQHRRDIAALKRTTIALVRQFALLQRRAASAPAAPSDDAKGKIRFVAKGLKSQRGRLGLSAADYGKLVGVTAQSVYNWEQGQSTPRAEQLKAIAALRSIGKREAHERLKKLAPRRAKKLRGRKR